MFLGNCIIWIFVFLFFLPTAASASRLANTALTTMLYDPDRDRVHEVVDRLEI